MRMLQVSHIKLIPPILQEELREFDEQTQLDVREFRHRIAEVGTWVSEDGLKITVGFGPDVQTHP